MNNNNPPADWAWPALIQSLQRDIGQLRELMDEARRETIQVREIHRKELDALIDQLRSVRSELDPIVKERSDERRLARETRWSWIERTGWVVMGGLALAAWEFMRRHLND
jgi:Spy/CpxP family protein refolding chaperone